MNQKLPRSSLGLKSSFCAGAANKVSTGDWVDPNNGQLYEREVVTFPHFHISLHNKEYDPVRWRIMEEGKYYEDDVHDRFVRILKDAPPSTVLDVGANIGYYTLLSAALGHQVISFEPNPTNVLRLCDSLRLNEWENSVQIFRNAVSNENGKNMVLHVPRNPGAGFLREPDQEKDAKIDVMHIAETTLVTLDAIADSEGWAQQSRMFLILKVDVEGKEPQVIMGASKLLRAGLVQNILMEGRRFGRSNLRESIELLFETGYRVREPNDITLSNAEGSPGQMTEQVIKYYEDKLGKKSQRVVDMWWEKGNPAGLTSLHE